ncbi:TetR/AcrR family transcriptional regulator [Pseudovibrio sp. Ad37]|uniref:TetR/AcrR family transcriptional regulator n=1 Tax=Pseudovibrio sp. Ad37 TaxID=989422 RepID=UPI0007AE8252|nr:TetR/AcrR family transcriptional regulator [Pseudovibrio sp. Ad37]KZL13794.1 HTH-type transcriptional regulator SrpR [Pseudovibrio sp. Ad37]
MGKIEQNKEKKRRAILEAAQHVFLSEGYILASMDKIADQAQVTKQTVYRYFSSKIDLFQATLMHMGSDSEDNFFDHLKKPDRKDALEGFGVSFIHAHLSSNHLSTFRLLVAESAKAPEITSTFFSVGPNETDTTLAAFFTDRLGLAEPDTAVRLWTSMLLGFRDCVLMGMPRPSDQQIEQHVKAATELLLANTAKQQA